MTKEQIFELLEEFSDQKQYLIDGNKVEMYTFSIDTLLCAAQNIAYTMSESTPPASREQEWIMVEDRLPNPGTRVMVWDGNWIGTGQTMNDEERKLSEEIYETKFSEKVFDNADWHFPSEDITHWQPLPAPPPEKQIS